MKQPKINCQDLANVTVTYKILADTIAHMFIGAFEGGSSNWLVSAEQSAGDKPSNPNLVWWGSQNIYNERLEITVIDYEKTVRVIKWKDIQRGLNTMAEIQPLAFSQLISENDDMYTADAFLQCIVFGEVVYG